MRTAIAVLVVLLAGVAQANPTPDWPVLFVDFDEDGIPDGQSNAVVTPAYYTTVRAYVGISCGSVDPSRSFSAVSFKLSNPLVECPGVVVTNTFTNLLPGGISVGDVYNGGITLTPAECVTTPCVFLGRVDMFYLGGSCCIQILDHDEYPRWVVDCQDPPQVHYYCLGDHGTIGAATCPAGEGCAFFPCSNPVPVEDVTWSAVKALYQ